MKGISEKRLRRMEEAAPVRLELLARHDACMVCGHSPRRPWKDKPRECSQLCVHEIANGVNRQKALDKPFACLVLCWYCNQYEMTNKRKWPEARQLAVLLKKSPNDYDLAAYLELTNPRAPNRIEQSEVDSWKC